MRALPDWLTARPIAHRGLHDAGAGVPENTLPAFEAAIRDDRHDLLAIALCTELCTELTEGGVEDLHFYTLNKPQLTREVARALGCVPEVELRDVA